MKKSKKEARRPESRDDGPARQIFEPDKQYPVKKFARFKSTRVQTCINIFADGNAFLDIRQWYTSNKFKDGEYRPTGKGLSIHIRDLDDLAEAIAKALRIVKKKKIKAEDPPGDDDYD